MNHDTDAEQAATATDAPRSRFPRTVDRTPSALVTRVSAERPDGQRAPLTTIETPFGCMAYSLGAEGQVYWHAAWPDYPEAEYADELPADDPRYVRQFVRVHAPWTVNGKAYGMSGQFERNRHGVLYLTAYTGLGADLTPAARRKLTEWAEAHWTELHTEALTVGARLARANREHADALRDLDAATEALTVATAAAGNAAAEQADALTAWAAL